MRNLIVSRSRRILRPLMNYQEFYEHIIDLPTYLEDLHLEESEQLIGIYENQPSKKDYCIVVTNFGLHFFEQEDWKHVKYEQFVKNSIAEDKEKADGLTLHLTSNKRINLTILGEQGKFRDSFEFLRFLNRTLSDIQK